MKIAAHPLVVAVALGLVDPQVLATEEEPTPRGHSSERSLDLEEPEPAEFARIEAEWQQVRDLV